MIDNGSTVIDIGCDHGLLDIYLTKNKNCICTASDISLKVLENTKININKYELNDRISVICSDGLNNIDNKLDDIVVISGMGTTTIIDILKNTKVMNINSLIIQSNNEVDILRKKVTKLGFYIFAEKIVNDKNKDYIIIYFKRGYKRYFNFDYLFGPIARKDSQNKLYFKKIYQKNNEILKKIPNKHIIKKIKQIYYLYILKKFTSMNV